MVRHYKYKRRGKKRGRRNYKKKMPTNRTGYLSIRQKDFFSITLPSGPLPNGYIKQLVFNLSSLPNWGEFDRLFDQYRLCAVAGSFSPHTNTNDTINPGQSYIQSVDLDGGVITTYDQLLACANAKQSAWNTAGGMVPTKKWYVKPRTAQVIIKDPDAVPITYSNVLGRKGAWIDLADGGDTEHFGMNFGWRTASPVGLNQPQVVNCNITYYIQFRKVR
ncbi:MAG: capsid protein [Cressdnaviricota sp.]|nr:MAG: capsid protein [Cressdnaviricota sp.]